MPLRFVDGIRMAEGAPVVDSFTQREWDGFACPVPNAVRGYAAVITIPSITHKTNSLIDTSNILDCYAHGQSRPTISLTQ